MPGLIDTHCHLDMLKAEIPDVLSAAEGAGVEKVITISVDEASQSRVMSLSREWPNVFGTLGVHPHSASDYHAGMSDQIRNAFSEQSRRNQESSPNLLAIGEAGLDYHYLYSPKEAQEHAFREQLILADELDLPLVMHTREAEQDTMKILREFPLAKKGVAHSFTSSLEMAEELIEMGWYLGINGIVTFKNAEGLRQVVLHTPLERLLLETDSPYLSPDPFRGRPNSPERVSVICAFLAELLDVEEEELARQTSQNARELFGDF
ncbi:uncharacterized protein METZ01_LOCUS315960 [marine metagenome]|uniref:Hydrolase TatD n=1 Tax=marine metagenome TaxID=408172 RepID=A0A382NPS5_9ZZZZ